MSTLKQRMAKQFAPYFAPSRVSGGVVWNVTQEGKGMAFSTLWFSMEAMIEWFNEADCVGKICFEPTDDCDPKMRGMWQHSLTYCGYKLYLGWVGFAQNIYIRDGKKEDTASARLSTMEEMQAWVMDIWKQNQKRWGVYHE